MQAQLSSDDFVEIISNVLIAFKGDMDAMIKAEIAEVAKVFEAGIAKVAAECEGLHDRVEAVKVMTLTVMKDHDTTAADLKALTDTADATLSTLADKVEATVKAVDISLDAKIAKVAADCRAFEEKVEAVTKAQADMTKMQDETATVIASLIDGQHSAKLATTKQSEIVEGIHKRIDALQKDVDACPAIELDPEVVERLVGEEMDRQMRGVAEGEARRDNQFLECRLDLSNAIRAIETQKQAIVDSSRALLDSLPDRVTARLDEMIPALTKQALPAVAMKILTDDDRFRGEKGDPGERGEAGPQGEKGVPGSAGEHGATGERGEKGDPGVPGEKGERGERGERGYDGHSIEFRGLWKTVHEYQPGDVVADGGSTWIALRKTHDERPSRPVDTGSRPWALVAQKGEKGVKGERGALGPAGPAGPPPSILDIRITGSTLHMVMEDGQLVEGQITDEFFEEVATKALRMRGR